MDSLNSFILARIIHVLGVVLWIGGVAFVTLVLLPALIKSQSPDKRLQLFESLEGKFSFQAKITTLVTMLSGIYMLDYMDAWYRYLDIQYWWLHLMTFIWLLFSLVLFVFEPLFLHAWFKQQAQINSEKTFARIYLMHKILLSLSLIAISGAVAGVRGF
jgi:uncharacterized membrane protein